VTTSTTSPAKGDITFTVNAPAIFGAGSVTASLVAAWVWKYLIQPRIEKVKHSFARTVETDHQILGRMYILLEKYKASRVLVYQPHNGITYTSGQHQWKVSNTHEVLERGVSSVKHWVQNEPSSEFMKNYPSLLKEGYCLLTLNSSLEDNPEVRHKFLNHGVKGCLNLTIKGYREDELIAFICIHWNDLDYVPTNIKDLGNLELETDKIRGLLLKDSQNPLIEVVQKLWKTS
jgi:hypothetical protein